MESIFPSGFPRPTAFYLTLYVLTFALHQFFMHYVIAGSLYLSWTTMFPGRGQVLRSDQPLAGTLRDWMPFMLSAAITAGVAPLLFVQIVYQRHFYTANILLGWRWMVVIPVLIVAFYLLYLIKSAAILRWPYLLRSAVPVAAAVCFLFVGFCWTANHLLANDEAHWSEIYVSSRMGFAPMEIACRMLIWVGGAFASMTLITGWQLVGDRERQDGGRPNPQTLHLSLISLSGLVVATMAGAGYIVQGGENIHGLLFSSLAMPYVIVSVVGIILQGIAWGMQLRRGLHRGLLMTASLGCLSTLFGVAVLRECIRLTSVNVTELYAGHATAAAIGGFTVFWVFAIVNSTVIVGLVWLVRRGFNRVT